VTEVCRSCKAPIRWAVTESERWIPLDLHPVPAGNLWLVPSRLRQGPPRALVVDPEDRERFAGELYLAHFATCPDANQHRRRPRGPS